MSPTSIVFFILLPLAFSHSQLTVPRPAATRTCSLSEPANGADSCPGPCDRRFTLDEVTATYQRNETINIKYQRNNHAPGGFIRITLVPEDEMMDKEVHDRNAFHYSCWGARTQVATAAEMNPVEGVSFVGTDGDSPPKAFYVSDVQIPPVIPDGVYIFGWSWFGGTKGGELENANPARIEPGPDGFFSDYWSCSKVRISGGPMADSYTPVFINDMPQFSNAGCMSANDELGVCSLEPCSADASFRQPRKFLGGDPMPITPSMFKEDDGAEVAEPGTDSDGGSEGTDETSSSGTSLSGRNRRKACRCLALSSRCWPAMANRTGGRCQARIAAEAQSPECKSACCEFCERKSHIRLCMDETVRDICSS